MALPSEEVIEKAKRDGILTRGVVLNHYATVEFALDEVLHRSRLCPDYRDAMPSGRLPREVAKRIGLLERLADLPGPLADLADELKPALRALLEYDDVRHMAAHGLMVITFDEAGVPTLIFRKFRDEKATLFASELTLNQDGVHFMTARLSLYARTVLQLMQRAVSLLPPLELKT